MRSEYHEGADSDQAVQVIRVSSDESFVGMREKFVFDVFIDFKRFENRGDVTEFGSLNHSSSNKVLNH